MNNIALAQVIIEKAFKDKTDKAGRPYVLHLNRVSANVPNYGFDSDLKTIALLHDILEDCPEWNETSLRTFFCDKIVDTIVILTRKKHESYEEYIERVVTDAWASTVKLADLTDNMDVTRLETLTDKDIERLRKYHRAYRRILRGVNE